MKILYTKDKNRRSCFTLLEKKKYILKYILNNLHFSKEIRQIAQCELTKLFNQYSITYIKNRCVLTNRARAIYRKFKMSRIFFKQYALEGTLMGVKKAS
jgi:ribosomal protein S14